MKSTYWRPISTIFAFCTSFHVDHCLSISAFNHINYNSEECTTIQVWLRLSKLLTLSLHFESFCPASGWPVWEMLKQLKLRKLRGDWKFASSNPSRILDRSGHSVHGKDKVRRKDTANCTAFFWKIPLIFKAPACPRCHCGSALWFWNHAPKGHSLSPDATPSQEFTGKIPHSTTNSQALMSTCFS